jgi:hypothetical protein
MAHETNLRAAQFFSAALPCISQAMSPKPPAIEAARRLDASYRKSRGESMNYTRIRVVVEFLPATLKTRFRAPKA